MSAIKWEIDASEELSPSDAKLDLILSASDMVMAVSGIWREAGLAVGGARGTSLPSTFGIFVLERRVKFELEREAASGS